MTVKKFFFEFTNFSLKDKMTYYVMNLSESFLVAMLISRLFSMNDTDSLMLIGIGLIMTPVGIAFAGGYKNIRKKFMTRHNLNENEFQ